MANKKTKDIPQTISTYETELTSLSRNFERWHADMDNYVDFYNYSAFYGSKSGSKKQSETVSVNLLRAFADKSIHFTSRLPLIKVPPAGVDEVARESADRREKLLLDTYRFNGMALQQRRMARDATNKSMACLETMFDLKRRCVILRRIDPRFVFWQYANDNDNSLLTLYIAYPMTKSEAKRRWGKDVGDGGLNIWEYTQMLDRFDDEEYVMYVKRYDSTSFAEWVGDTWITTPRIHGLDVIPVDTVMPIDDGEPQPKGDFFLRPLIPLQAELNEALRKKANIVRKMGNPAVWGRGIIRNQFEDVKSALMGEGSFIGLKGQGELGILTPPETKMIDDHIDRIIDSMMKISGFGSASFGESVGANTSGDALSMYFTPTDQKIGDEQIAWREFYESINSKVLAFYDRFLKTDEQKKINGYKPRSTFMGVSDKDSDGTIRAKYGSLGYADEVVTKDDIAGNYTSMALFQPPTPKDEVAYKRLLYESASSGFISRDTAYEEWGLQSPADEIEKLKSEQSDPAVNPEGTSKLISALGKVGSMGEQSQPPVDENPYQQNMGQEDELAGLLSAGDVEA